MKLDNEAHDLLRDFIDLRDCLERLHEMSFRHDAPRTEPWRIEFRRADMLLKMIPKRRS